VTDWLLVDGSSLIFRAFFGNPKTFKAPDGSLVNAARGFFESLARYLLDRRPRHLAIATDEDWRPAFRVEVLPSYKSQRVAEPIPPELEPQMPVIMDFLAAMGIDVVGAAGFEAEDVIASLAPRIEGSIEILSGDRDLFALVRDPDIKVLYPSIKGMTVVDEAEVEKIYGIPGRAYADFAALRGDPSDGLPGLPGVGPQKAAGLVRRYGGVEGLLAAGVLSARDAEYLEKAWRVVAQVGDIPLEVPRGCRDTYPDDPDGLSRLQERYGLKSSCDRLLAAASQTLTCEAPG
jgi:5'-3' exonuclease